MLNVAEAGQNIVSIPQLYGTTHTLFAHILPKLGVQVRFGRSDQAAELEALIDGDTRALFCEPVGNPAGNICDLEALAAVARRAQVPFIVDNTVPTPILVRPIEFGADIVVHSLTKFLGGHGTTLGGAIVDSGRFPWTQHAARFPAFTEPDESYHGLIYTEHYGDKAFLGRARGVFQRTMGAVLSPFNAFLLLQGIETVALRVERHVENARRVAEFLRQDPRVASISYAGFPDNPYYALAQKYLGGRACSLLTFAIRGGYDAGTRFYDTRYPQTLSEAFRVSADFMPSNVAQLDPYLNTMQWSRRFLGLRLFLSPATAGWQGYGQHVERSVELIARLKERLLARGWSIANDSQLAVLCVVPPPGSPKIRDVVRRVLESGRAWVAVSTYEGREVLRICATHGESTLADVEELVVALTATA
jgi:hypothetical protein